jgi:hypothetical protein
LLDEYRSIRQLRLELAVEASHSDG